MKLISTECPKCKGKIKISEDTKKAKCEYCGNQFVIDDEVKKVKHIMVGQIDEEQEFKNAKANLKFKEYGKAFNIYYSLSERYTDNKEVWLGLLRASTEDFTSKEYREDAKKYYEKFSLLATESEIEKYKTKYEKYINSFSESEIVDAKNKKINNGKDYIVLTLLGGFLGLHKFAKGKIAIGFLYLFTCGLLGIGWIYDCFMEVRKHPEARNKVYNCLSVYVFLVAFAYIDYNAFGSILMIVSGLLMITPISRKVWKKPTASSKFIKLALFIIGFILCISSIPPYYKNWTNDGIKVTINNQTTLTIITKENSNGKEYDYSIKENDNDVIISTKNNEYKFKYDKVKNILCLLDDNKCVSEFWEEK